MEAMTWNRIRSGEDVMVWLEHGFLPNVWGTVAGKVIRRPGLILNRNLMVGGVRGRQRRANLGSCNLLDALEAWCTIECRQPHGLASEDFGPLTSVNLSVIDEMPMAAQYAYASRDGFYDAHFDVERPLRDALETATYLRRNNWLTSATTSLELEALMLNGESGNFAILSITFEWLYDGAVTKRVRSHVFRAVPGMLSVMDYLPEICWLGLILVLLNQELWEVLRMTMKRELRSLASFRQQHSLPELQRHVWFFSSHFDFWCPFRLRPKGKPQIHFGLKLHHAFCTNIHSSRETCPKSMLGSPEVLRWTISLAPQVSFLLVTCVLIQTIST